MRRVKGPNARDLAIQEEVEKRRIKNKLDDLDFYRRRFNEQDSTYPSKSHAEELKEYEFYINQEWHL